MSVNKSHVGERPRDFATGWPTRVRWNSPDKNRWPNAQGELVMIDGGFGKVVFDDSERPELVVLDMLTWYDSAGIPRMPLVEAIEKGAVR